MRRFKFRAFGKNINVLVRVRFFTLTKPADTFLKGLDYANTSRKEN